ncbi:MAG: hypothetical protein EP318_20255 [Rhodobacteraceae bacterium]|nr:MAG: hypothetical protein EP318_20255 [Paracoccaceae bacterium]
MAEILAELRTSMIRRVIGVGTMFGLGALLLYLALSRSFEGLVWQVLLIVLAGAALYAAMRMHQATAMHLVLTEEGLADSEGHLLVGYDDIVSVERGMLAFKPSNGFMIFARDPLERRWRPGLYWVLGRRIGVGGVTAGSHSKFMADLMNMKLAERRGDLPG